ncbi:MAG: hypothetical protein J0H10_09075 [Alphaproteobacteria bacterium]|nr:hypothetical protein [Alphaproteobacteria bacterium]
MALNRQIARLAKILVDSEGIGFDEAQARLESLTLEVVVGDDAVSPAAHAAVLTTVSVGRRTFVGGVRVRGALNQTLNTALPLLAETLGEAAVEVGASEFEGAPARRIYIGTSDADDRSWSVAARWDGWRAGVTEVGGATSGTGDNPLAGIAAGALAVGAAFQTERGRDVQVKSELNLWPAERSGEEAPAFAEVFLPGALWLIGLGNLGQAFLWALSALPYADPTTVSLVLQDHDKVTEENWATSVLVRDETYGLLKTKVVERWAEAKGFDVRRIDRRLVAGDRTDIDDPRLALSGVDKIAVRKLMGAVGFDCIVDAGLGRTAADFDRYRVSVFDQTRPIDQHFATVQDEPVKVEILDQEAYRHLEAEIGSCGTAEVAGASVAAPYVSAIAASVAVSRLIAVTSGCACPASEVGRVSSIEARRTAPHTSTQARGIRHAGRPIVT